MLADTWPEAARRHLAAAACAGYLGTSEAKSAALHSLQLQGSLANLEPLVRVCAATALSCRSLVHTTPDRGREQSTPTVGSSCAAWASVVSICDCVLMWVRVPHRELMSCFVFRPPKTLTLNTLDPRHVCRTG